MTGWPTIDDVSAALGIPFVDDGDAAAAAAALDAATTYAQRRSPVVWRDVEDSTVRDPDTGTVTTPGYPRPDAFQGIVMLACHLYARRPGGGLTGDVDVESTTMLDPVVGRLLGLGRHATPRVG